MTVIASLQLWRSQSRIISWIREERTTTNYVVTGVQGTAEEMDEAGDTLLVTNSAQS
jgi:hypothetical protein